MSLTKKEIEEALDIFRASRFAELRLDIGALKLEVRKDAAPLERVASVAPSPIVVSPVNKPD